MTKSQSQNMTDFEKHLDELEQIVARMDEGEQSLEENLKDFERGMALSAKCQKSLDAAQLKVDKLVEKYDQFDFESFDPISE